MVRLSLISLNPYSARMLCDKLFPTFYFFPCGIFCGVPLEIVTNGDGKRIRRIEVLNGLI